MKHELVKDHAERKRLLALIERCEREQTMSDDLIRRSDVLKVLSLYGWTPIDGLYDTIAHDLPSADRPQGFWTKTDVATYRCSECGKIQIADDVNELNYCCCCGSRNKVRYKVQMLKGADDE